MDNALTFSKQAEAYMLDIAKELKPNTFRVYRSLLDAQILPAIGEVSLSDVDNKTAKSLVGRLAEASLSPATVGLAVTLVKQIVKSAVDDRGNPLYPVQWNGSFIKAPKIDPNSQKAPITPLETLQEAISRMKGRDKALLLILASTGLRIGEALAIGQGNVWCQTSGTITVNGTMVRGEYQPSPKTRAGERVVDLNPAINAELISLVGSVQGPLFTQSDRTYRYHFDELGIPGFHSLRRFRITHLRAVAEAPEPLTKFWAGHAAKDTTERYTKVKSQVQARAEWAEKAGLGFELKK